MAEGGAGGVAGAGAGGVHREGGDGDWVFYRGASSPIWNNTGDTLWLQNAAGAQVLAYSYTD